MIYSGRGKPFPEEGIQGIEFSNSLKHEYKMTSVMLMRRVLPISNSQTKY